MERKTSIIILTYNNLEYTKNCLESIYKYTDKDTYEIIIIDNCSVDGTKEYLKELKNIKLILNDENLGFPKGCNQGIKIANKDNDILLLNNDTIVTQNWLRNLKICLNSDKNIGAVGAVCNQNENLQGVDFTYNDLETMQLLASNNNISDPNKWEEKTFLIGFCLLIKKEVIDKINTLDEEYTPGYIEDNDLSLRIINLGYKLMLCHDCFIHHYLGTAFRKDLSKFYPILYKNRDYFLKKWHFNTFCFDDVKTASFPLINNPSKVLELNSGIGNTILSLKYKFKNIKIEGIEKDEFKRQLATKFTNVYKNLNEVKNNDYDYILIGDILEKVNNPEQFLNKIKKYLKDDGYIIGEFSNASSIKNLISLVNDKCYINNKKNNFTLTDMNILLNKVGLNIQNIFSWYEKLTEEENNFLEYLNKIYPHNYQFTYYTFKASK